MDAIQQMQRKMNHRNVFLELELLLRDLSGALLWDSCRNVSNRERFFIFGENATGSVYITCLKGGVAV